MISFLYTVAPYFGGIFLIIGAKLLSEGKALLSLAFYFLADLCWVILALKGEDYFGAIAITIGILYSVKVIYKMQTGEFVKDLNKENNVNAI